MKNTKLIIALFLFSQIIFAQEMTITGVVRDSIGTIVGVNVGVKGTHRGAQTDFDGKYSIKAKAGEILVFSYIGMKTQEIIADKKEINVKLSESETLRESVDSTYYHQTKKLEAIRTITEKDIKNAGNPKYNFKKNAKNNVYIIFASELTSYDFNKEDIEFQQKYNVKYSLIGSYKIDYLKKYNKLTFKHLKKKYKKSWLTEIRKDAIGLEKE